MGTFSKICGNLGEKKISKICWNNLQDLWECGREKKIPKICGRDFLAYTREKKSTRFVGEIFTRFSSLSPRKKNLQDLWDYFLGSKINKICGPHILLIFFLQEKWIYPQDSHVSCPRNSKISLEELYPHSLSLSLTLAAFVHTLPKTHFHQSVREALQASMGNIHQQLLQLIALLN